MQYPPQQPLNQPSYAPAEMVMQEQVQMYAPARDITQPLMLAQEIAIYPNRTQAIWRTIVCVICLLVAILILPFIAIIGAITGSPLEASDLVSLIVVIPGIIFIGWMAWRMASNFLFNRQPILRINHDGITVGKVPMLSGYSISWAEIDAIFSSRYLYKYFCIMPKNPDEYLARFKGMDRFNRRLNSVIGAPLYMPQTYLERPIEEIINAIYAGYVSELAQNRVQLRP